MIKIYFFFTILFIVSTITKSFTQCGTNLLTNPGFDDPTLQPAIGNNLTGLFTFGSWTMTGGPFNIIQTDSSAYPGGPDNAKNGTQYIDVTNAAGTVYQDFTVTGSGGNIAFGGSFSSRENNASYVNWSGKVEIYALPGNTLVSSSTSINFINTDGDIPAQEAWKQVTGNVNLPVGLYRYVAVIGDYGNFDAAFVFQNCILPISISSFTANYQNNSILLKWSLVTNNTNVNLERSTNGVNFNSISQLNNNHNFSDNNIIENAIYYYRLKIIEPNGVINYSNIIKAATGKTNGIVITQNPVTTTLSLSGLKENGYINIIDANGKVIIKQIISAQNITVNTSKLTTGMYMIQEVDGNDVNTKRFLKQ